MDSTGGEDPLFERETLDFRQARSRWLAGRGMSLDPHDQPSQELLEGISPRLVTVARERLMSNAPSLLQAQMADIFVGMDVENGWPNAYATTLANHRIALMNRACSSLVTAFGVILTNFWDDYGDFILPIIRDAPKRRGTLPELIDAHAEWVERYIAERPLPDNQLGVIRLVRDQFGSGEPVSEIRPFLAFSSNPAFAFAVLDTAHWFVFAHEFAHHLLGHLGDSETMAGKTALRLALERMRFDLPVGANSSQTAEYEADALGFLLTVGRSRDPGDWVMGVGGAAAAMAALTVVGSTGGDGFGAGRVDAPKGSHPSLYSRLVTMLHITTIAAPRDPGYIPELGRASDGNIAVSLMRVVACGMFIERLGLFDLKD